MRALLAGLVLCACSAAPPAPDPAPPCVPDDALLSRRYDQVAYLTAHNAMSNMDEGFNLPNQRWGIERQLEDGVRGFMLDVYDKDGRATLCHADCILGSRDFADALTAFRTFLEANPTAVVTFQVEDHAPFTLIDTAFRESGLDAFVRVQPKNTPWPTLRGLISAGERVIVFSENLGGSAPWYHDLWAFTQETHYSFDAPEKMDCSPNRGTAGASLFTMNHFLTKVGGSLELAQQVNFDPFLSDRIHRCTEERGLEPNFVAVDFYDVGDACAAVQALNAD